LRKTLSFGPNKLIEEGSIISSNLIWGDKWKSSLFEGGKVSGRTNIELSNEMTAKLAASFGSILPLGKTILMSRDYHRASRMLKRSFLGGLLGSGLNVIDLKLMPLPVMRFLLSNTDAIGGVHFRQSPENPTITEILFYDNDGLLIDTNTEKSIERIFFRESFRRVNYNEIGEIKDEPLPLKSYKEKFLSLIDQESIKSHKFKIIADLLNGSTSIVYPDIVNTIGIENIILNAYFDEKKLSQISTLHKKSAEEISKMVNVLSADIGFVMYPNGQRIVIISDNGEILDNEAAILIILYLIDKTVNRQVKVYLPVYVPEVMDEMFENIIVERGKTIGLKSNFLKDYYFFGNLEGNYTFTEMSYSFDGMFASIKILEMLSKTKQKISDIQKIIPNHYFEHKVVSCPINLKGKMMRKFTEEAIGKDASFVDGVKIFIDKKTWILMLPDQYADSLHLYVNSDKEEKAKAVLNEYIDKINKWME
jgi:Phosphomannomutase